MVDWMVDSSVAQKAMLTVDSWGFSMVADWAGQRAVHLVLM